MVYSAARQAYPAGRRRLVSHQPPNRVSARVAVAGARGFHHAGKTGRPDMAYSVGLDQHASLRSQRYNHTPCVERLQCPAVFCHGGRVAEGLSAEERGLLFVENQAGGRGQQRASFRLGRRGIQQHRTPFAGRTP